MRYLLDTQVLIWAMEKSNKLKSKGRAVIESRKNELAVSVVTIWEMLIKKKLGELKVPDQIKEDLDKAGFSILSLTIDQVLVVDKLPLYHKDPFDRMLVSQAMAEDLTLITADSKLEKYQVKLLKV